MFHPFLTGFVFFAIPAKFDSFFLRTRDKRAASTHSGFSFTSAALTCTFSMVMRAKSARKPANTNFRVFYFHSYPFTLISPGISIIMNHTGNENKKRKVTG